MTQAPVDRVIVLNDFCHVQGGASKVAIDEAVGLAEAGVDVTFLGAVGPICEALRDAPLRVVCLDQPQLLDVARHPGVALRGMYNRAASAAMLELIARQDPRTCAIHLHGYTKALTATPALVARRAGFRISALSMISSPRARMVRSTTTTDKSHARWSRCPPLAWRPPATSGIGCTRHIALRAAWHNVTSLGFPLAFTTT